MILFILAGVIADPDLDHTLTHASTNKNLEAEVPVDPEALVVPGALVVPPRANVTVTRPEKILAQNQGQDQFLGLGRDHRKDLLRQQRKAKKMEMLIIKKKMQSDCLKNSVEYKTKHKTWN